MINKLKTIRVFIRYFYSNVPQVIRDSDVLSQQQINNLLGRNFSNDLQLKQTKKTQITKGQLFYDLISVKNVPYPPCIDPNFIPVSDTPNRNLFAALNLDVNSSFEDYSKGISKYWTEQELYGNTTELQIIDPDSLQFSLYLTPFSKYLSIMRDKLIPNISLPGAIQREDARNFLQLRPVSEFRHTPIIPISDFQMQQHKQSVQRYHYQMMHYSIKAQKVVNGMLIIGTLTLIGYLISIALSMEEERSMAYERIKYNRKHNIQSTVGVKYF